jgi:predicted enzyme related to lactoylglutathione lyase
MAAQLTELVIESADPLAAARFWSGALGWDLQEYMPGHVPWLSASGEAGGHDLKLVFVKARADRPPGTRLYLNPLGSELADEISRLTSLGATSTAEGSSNPWVSMTDPAGTGFTLLANRID